MARLEILCHKEECNVVLKLGPRRVFSTWLSWICWMNPDFIDTLFLYGKWLNITPYVPITTPHKDGVQVDSTVKVNQ